MVLLYAECIVFIYLTENGFGYTQLTCTIVHAPCSMPQLRIASHVYVNDYMCTERYIIADSYLHGYKVYNHSSYADSFADGYLWKVIHVSADSFSGNSNSFFKLAESFFEQFCEEVLRKVFVTVLQTGFAESFCDSFADSLYG